MVYVLSFLIGTIAGLRTMTAPAMLSWAAGFGWLDPGGTWLAFFSTAWARWVFTLFAVGEWVVDQLPATPSRTIPPAFAARILSGAICGAALAAGAGAVPGGMVAGSLGAIAGTLGGRAFRARLAARFGKDRPAALIEDAIAIGGALLIVAARS
ncbi:MAG: DUF4126 domain-containing protein [Gemmatimonadetes bacterium]|nr:DUF4126 domain-containing protein [Gemmatimonadota bacterium]